MRKAINVALWTFATMLLLSPQTTVSQDWPQWRGANRDAKATGFRAPANWPKELTKKWSTKVGNGVATPALVDGKLYVFARDGEQEMLRCLDAATGNEIWKQGYEEDPAEGAAGSFPGPRSSPTVAQGKVITLGVRGILKCRNTSDGKQLWMKADLANSWPMFYTSSSPIVVDGQCIAQLGGPQDGGIVAYDLATGNEKWRWMQSGPAYASPVLMTVGGTKAIVVPCEGGRNDGKLVALEAATGKLLWQIPYSEVRYIATTPIVDGSTLIVAGPGSGMSAFKLKMQDGKLVEEKLWSNPDNSVGFNTPVLKDGFVYGLSGGDQLFCINLQSQKTAWSAPLAKPAANGQKSARQDVKQHNSARVPATYVQFVQQDQRDGANPPPRQPGAAPSPEGPGRFGPGRGFGGQGRGMGGMGRGMMGGSRGYGSVVDAGSVLMALSPAGELVVFKPSGEAYHELARYKVADGGTYAYPIPSGNGIYVKDQDSVTLWTVK